MAVRRPLISTSVPPGMPRNAIWVVPLPPLPRDMPKLPAPTVEGSFLARVSKSAAPVFSSAADERTSTGATATVSAVGML